MRVLKKVADGAYQPFLYASYSVSLMNAEYTRITHSTAFYTALQGIKSSSSIGSPATEMRLVYDIGLNSKEDERTLSIELGEDGRMTGAKLLESATRIDDIVAAYLPSQDLRMLVQEVRTRISR